MHALLSRKQERTQWHAMRSKFDNSCELVRPACTCRGQPSTGLPRQSRTYRKPIDVPTTISILPSLRCAMTEGQWGLNGALMVAAGRNGDRMLQIRTEDQVDVLGWVSAGLSGLVEVVLGNISTSAPGHMAF